MLLVCILQQGLVSIFFWWSKSKRSKRLKKHTPPSRLVASPTVGRQPPRKSRLSRTCNLLPFSWRYWNTWNLPHLGLTSTRPYHSSPRICVTLPDVNHPLRRDRTWRYDPGPCRQKPWLQHAGPVDDTMGLCLSLWHDYADLEWFREMQIMILTQDNCSHGQVHQKKRTPEAYGLFKGRCHLEKK